MLRLRMTAAFTFSSAAAVLSPSVLGAYGDAVVPLAGMISNVMVTRAYRHLKLSLVPGYCHSIGVLSPVAFAPSNSVHEMSTIA